MANNRAWPADRQSQHGERWTPERRLKARELYDGGMTLPEVAAQLKSNNARCAAAIRAAGGTIRRTGARTPEKNRAWKGGRILDVDGYVLLLSSLHPNANAGGYVREHRLVMEKMLGRYLLPTEVVHHKNGDHADNRPENLEVFASNGEHLAEELAGKCPNWTPEGRARILEGVRKPRRKSPT